MKGLAALRPASFGFDAWNFSDFRDMKGTTKRACRQVRLSTLRYSRAKICGLSRYANLEIRITQCLLPSVVKDRRSVHQFPIGTSPLPAERGIGLEPKSRANKKPGDERRASPSYSCGRSYPAPPERMCSKLDFFLPGIRNQPHLWMSRQTRFVRTIPGKSEVRRHQGSIAKKKISSSICNNYFGEMNCGIRRFLWKRSARADFTLHRWAANELGSCGQATILLRCLKNSTWRKRFEASALVL